MRREKWFALVLTLLVSFSLKNTYDSKSQGPIANLTLKTNGGGVRPDMGLFIDQYLADIGIQVEVKVEEWIVFLGTLFLTHNYDLSIVEIGSNLLFPSENSLPIRVGGNSLDMRELFTDNGLLNFFGLGPDIPYYNESLTLQNRILNETNPSNRQQLAYTWQQLMVDKILPFLPLFGYRNYEVVWANTEGYDSRWGISNSLPYMNYDGLHEGQNNQSEFMMASFNWKESNPLFITDSASYLLADLVFEPMIQIDPDLVPIKTGIVESWTMVDDFHYAFTLRDNLYWAPSYNVTMRNSTSPPLSSIPEGELMIGLKSGEFSNGSNQKITAKDAVFTYLAHSNPHLVYFNPLIKGNTSSFDWISNIYVEPSDNLTFHIHIDGNPFTLELDFFPDFWSQLPKLILPEFFLNSTNTTISYSAGGVKTVGMFPEIINSPQWDSYSSSAFGNGKFMLDYWTPNSVTVLQKNPNWFGVGAKEGISGKEPFVETLKIRVIPDNSAELAEFKNGVLDWADVTTLPSERKIMQADPKYIVESHTNNKMSALAFNLRRPFIGGVYNFEFLNDPDGEGYTRGVGIRKAICYAIDRDHINSVIHDDENYIIHSIISPANAYYYYNDILKYHYDTEAAFCWLEGIIPGINPDYNDRYNYVVPIIFLPIIFLISLPSDFWHKILKKLQKKS